MKIQTILFMLILGIMLSSFEGTGKLKLLAGTWKPVKMGPAGKEASEPEDTDKRLVFKKDGTYSVDDNEKGTWKKTDRKNIIQLEGDWSYVMTIEKLTKKELVFMVEENGDKMRAYCVAVPE